MADQLSTRFSLVAVLFLVLFLPQGISYAQSPAPKPGAQQPSQQTPQPSAASEKLLTNQQVEQLVAPIALYPDALLSVILMASTYPLEVVEADRWLGSNKNLKGDALKGAADKKGWDDSVKALVATPDALNMMNADLEWTKNLGDAVLAQQADVMDAIQRLRTKAQQNDKLKSTREQTVTVKQDSGKNIIVIEPTQPNTVYVPYYDPAVVYGSWPYPAYPPYIFPRPPYIAAGIVATGLAFGAGYAVGRWASGGSYWGGGVNWGNNNINVNRPININNINNANNRWQHNPVHRQGVKYTNAAVQNRFGNNSAAGAKDRTDFRGHNDRQALNPSANRPGAGGNRPSDRQPAANRPGKANTPARRANTPPRQAAKGNRPQHDGAFGNISSGRVAHMQSSRGQASMAGRGGGHVGGGHVGGGHVGGGHVGGGRRSDMRLKHGLALLGTLDNGLGFYRFSYNGSEKTYVGVIAQEVQTIMPEAVTMGADGYLRVYYDRIGLRFETYSQWVSEGSHIPSVSKLHSN